MHNLGNFFHKVGIEWTLHLPNNTQILFSDTIVIHIARHYTNPDRDFCLFSSFPFAKNITAFLDSSGLLDCTSTFSWLIQNYDQYNLSSELYFTNRARFIYDICLNDSILTPKIESFRFCVPKSPTF
jgi:hypothetical protein